MVLLSWILFLNVEHNLFMMVKLKPYHILLKKYVLGFTCDSGNNIFIFLMIQLMLEYKLPEQ